MYFVRADGNAKIGAGHMMRCLTIIEELVRLTGAKDEILFVCADDASASLVRERGFRAKSLGTDYRDMESELPAWRALISEKEVHTILVDSYYVTEIYLQKLREYGRLILLDDMQQKAFPVDAIVNYNIFAREEQYRQLYSENKVEYYIGGSYVPVRPQFLNVEYCVTNRVSDVLITTGGGDVDNIAGAVLEAIYDRKLNYHLITGKFNPHLEKLEQFALCCKNVHIYHDVKDMAGIMQKCDIAITAGGTTIYELSAIGVPFICFSYAENQEALTSYIGEYDIACFAGAYHRAPKQVLERMAFLVSELCEDKKKRIMCNEKERKLIDGMGAERLARVMLI